MTRNALALFLLGGGLVGLLGAGSWWWLTYREVIAYDYIAVGEAARCLVGDSEICRLARALCRSAHPRLLGDYAPWLLWCAGLVFSVGLLGLSPRAEPL